MFFGLVSFLTNFVSFHEAAISANPSSRTQLLYILFLISYCSLPLMCNFFQVWSFLEYRQKAEYSAGLFLKHR